MQRVTRSSARADIVVVGYDGSSDGAAALRWAARDVEARGAHLRVVRAWQWDGELAVLLRQLSPADMEAVARKQTWTTLCGLSSALSRRPEVLDVVVSGDEPGRAILSATHDAAAVVMGRGRLNKRKRLFVGSVGDFVLEHMSCPVVVVPADVLIEEEADRGFIVVGVDGSPEANAALAFAAREAIQANAALTIVAVQSRRSVDGTPWNETMSVQEANGVRQRTLHDAKEYVRRLPRGSEVPLELRIYAGEPGPCLVTAAARGQLLVVGTHGRGWLGRLALGSVSRYCVQHSTVPVAVVPRV